MDRVERAELGGSEPARCDEHTIADPHEIESGKYVAHTLADSVAQRETRSFNLDAREPARHEGTLCSQEARECRRLRLADDELNDRR